MENKQIIEELRIHQIELEMQNEELKKAHSKLQSEKNKYMSLVNLLPLGFVILDESYKIQFYNKWISDFFNYSDINFINNEIYKFIDSDFQDEFYYTMKNARNEPAKNFSTVLILKNGNNANIFTQWNLRFQKSDATYHITIEDVTESKLQETEIIKHEQRLKQSYIIASIGSWEYDLNTNLINISNETLDLLNIENVNNNFKFEDAVSLVDDVSRKDVMDYFSDIERINEKSKITIRISKNFDTTKYFSLQGSVLYDHTKKPYKVVGVLKDITNRVKSEEMKLKYKAFLDNSHDAIIGIDTESQIYSWNKAAEKIYLFTEEEVLGKKLTDICKPGKNSFDCRYLIDKVLNGEDVSDVHVQRYDKNNNLKEILVSISKIIQNNEHTGYSVVMRDITQLVDYNKELKKWQKAIEQSANIVVITDDDGFVEFANKKFYEVTGYNESEVKNKKLNILKSGYHSKDFYTELWNSITAGEVWKGEILNRKKDGTTYWESASISPVFDENENIINFIAIKEDITRNKKQQEELAKARAMSEKANSIKSVILGNISHELRTPLNGIIGGVQILKSFEDDAYDDVIGIIDSSSERLKDALELLLDLSKMQTEDENIFFQEVNISELLKHLIYHYEDICKSNNLKFVADLAHNDLVYKLDSNLFEKMINQLFRNSAKFSDTGNITLRAFRNEKGQIEINLEDEGVGIPEDKLKTILEEFRQVSEGINRKYEGLGLGLTFVIKIVELFNGNFYIESKENEGTKVRIVFPVNS